MVFAVYLLLFFYEKVVGLIVFCGRYFSENVKKTGFWKVEFVVLC